jgi:hypothetical protein
MLTNYCVGIQIEQDEVVGGCGMHKGEEKCIQGFVMET